MIGATSGITESYYAISPERKLKHPAVKEIIAGAKSLFS
jgi:LysR family transcriptional activator of nhaA